MRPLYVAIGDSLTVGIGSTFFQPNFVKLYHRDLEAYYRTQIEQRVYAKNGATTEGIRHILAQPEVAEAVANASFITLTGGGNDFLKAGRKWMRTGDSSPIIEAAEQSMIHFDQMIRFIDSFHANNPNPFIVRVLNLYNPLFYIPNTNHWLEEYNKQLNDLERYPFVRVADIYRAFSGHEPQLLSFDRIHPNPIGYRVMAQVTAHLGLSFQ
ncbi:GDSL-type esterase/lipase family protein [Sporolactobacillus shoreicorticis]|uniref:GDSL-type esterase/lipase family protein n=1 Tax=Sporolactobacillus shoreicorticis TaxID=1923877 RepID=A0ABW5SAU9_9BACL|nr:GDSL-type esterase/lipase family protein [Sporolactobacillus shoreicorticis]MCO7127296.1 GDSL-type esterase/lipase family protein [Sporolactobacillus shoreicorticis]